MPAIMLGKSCVWLIIVKGAKRNNFPEKQGGIMKEYEFVLKFTLRDIETAPEVFIEKLGEAGCDDALIGIGVNGRIALDFTRESASALDAVLSAIKDVKRAIPDARLIEATPDLVGLTDVADILGFSRQNMRKLMLKNPDFPPPVHDGKPSIWHLAKILKWMEKENKYPIEESLFDIAETNMQFNIAKDMQDLEPAFRLNIEGLLA
jgi:predicted DNA-binding transcriptional regulator AlpA